MLSLQKLKSVNPNAANIHRVYLPYYYLFEHNHSEYAGKKWVVFLGSDFKNMPKGSDLEAFIKLTNQCLDYVRRECGEYTLYYKPHPAETDEHTFLNLNGFIVIDAGANTIAEIFFWKNRDKVYSVFSTISWGAMVAYEFGLNSYTFLKLFEPIFGRLIGGVKDYFWELPDSFFIESFNQKPVENKIIMKRDEHFESEVRKILPKCRGKVWFIVSDPGAVLVYVAYARLIHSFYPGQIINLVISRHHRWDVISMEDIKSYFDDILILPRIFYSLKPRRIWETIKLALRIRKIRMGTDDIIWGFAHPNLVENCFISYHPANRRIAISPSRYFELNYGIKPSAFYDYKEFKVRPAIFFYNYILEPLLGLYRTVYSEYGTGKTLNIGRYQKPLNEIYGGVYLVGR